MKKPILLLLVILLPLVIYSQTIHLSLPDKAVEQGTFFQVNLTTPDFTDIVSMQFSIHWDPAVIQYEYFEVTDLPFIALGDTDVDIGDLRFSWFDINGSGLTLNGETSLVRLSFTAVGNVGDQSNIFLSGNPLAVQIFKASGIPGVFNPVDLQQNEGLVTIIQEGEISFSLFPPSCSGTEDGEILLNVPANSNFQYHWQRADGFSSFDQDLIGISAGVYRIEIRNEDGFVFFSQLITLADPAPLGLGSVNLIETDCTEASGQATISASGGTSPYYYNMWNQGNSEGVFNNLAEGRYGVTITDLNNCQYMDSFYMSSFNGPFLDLGTDINLCTDTTIILGAGNYPSVQWSNGEITPVISIGESGTYSVTVTNEIGCSVEDTIVVDLMAPPSVVIGNDDLEICPGDTIQLQLSGADQYLWDASNNLSDEHIPNPLAFPDSTTIFVVLATNECGSDAEAVEVKIYNTLADAGQDTTIIAGTPVQLFALGGIAYLWEESFYPLSEADIPNPITSPEDSTIYFVNITDSNGCIIRDSVAVNVISDPLENIFVVNMITPNGDGLNDILEFRGSQILGKNSLIIYNRWGDVIYSKDDYQSDENRFDGTKNGKPLPAGNYYYVLTFPTGRIKQKLTIVR